MSRQLALFLAAAQFLTRLPVPALRGFDSSRLAQSARYFPLVGALIGATNVGVWWTASRWLPAAVSVGLMLAASLLLTGALHEDGFADTCDGLGGGTTADRALAIMKDSRIGAYGAIGIVVSLGLKWTMLTAVPAAVIPLIVIAAHTVSRWCALGLIWRLPYLRSGDRSLDEAKARPFAGNLSTGEWALSGTIGLIAVLLVAGLAARSSGDAHTEAMLEARALAAGLAGAMLTALVFAFHLRRRLGGYTGDCLGAVQQLAELAFLLGALALCNPLRRVA
ncbi:MAG TPA: adenosylcobinamide-GDP ribazoletransferase [Steroidobacteraceae bacterium]|nr:adenosylcobinamide-GDP ribazoletransferase [Steroidobacteraceae bacterium]